MSTDLELEQALVIADLQREVERLGDELRSLRKDTVEGQKEAPLYQQLRVAMAAHPNIFVFDRIGTWLQTRPGLVIAFDNVGASARVACSRGYAHPPPQGTWAAICEPERYGHPLLSAFELSTRMFERAELRHRQRLPP